MLPLNVLRGLGFPTVTLFQISLATTTNSLPNASRLKTRPQISSSLPSDELHLKPCRMTLFNFRLFSTPFRGTFQLSLALLVRYRTWIMFKVRSWYSYLHTPIMGYYSETCITTYDFFPTGVSPFNPPRSRGLWKIITSRSSSKHHIPPLSLMVIRFAFCRFHSPLLTASLLFSLPAVTKMFQFTAYPTISGQFRNLWFKGCMRLPRAFRSLPRPSSDIQAKPSIK